MKWQLASDQLPKTIDDVFDILLSARGVTEHDDFFSPRHPADLTLAELAINEGQISLALEILKRARDSKQKVVVFGDYDADGVCASTIMWQTLHRLGIAAMPFIPLREKHGYGVSMAAIDEITASAVPAVLITVDNGIVAHEPIQRLQDMGVQVIVTDHHQPEEKLPAAAAVVHTSKLCGSTVAWVFCRELIKALAPEELEWLNEQLDVAAIATIADQVPLLGANRSFAKHGMSRLKITQRVGLKLLMKDAGLEQSELDTYHINFAIAPRINAMGRLEHGLDALRLLCTGDGRRAEELVKLLAGTNTRRQDLTMSMLDQAVNQVGAVVTDKIIIVSSTEYHEGVIGLIAGRLMEKYSRPALAIRLGENGFAKGSARSIPGVNIVELLRQVRSELLEVGGHPMAAGFSLEVSKLDVFSQKIQAVAMEQITAEMLEPSLNLDCQLPSELITLATAQELQKLAPFGPANRTPVFELPPLELLDWRKIGQAEQHLKLNLLDPNSGREVVGMAWQKAELAAVCQPGDLVSLAAQLDVNSWKGRRSLQLIVKDLKQQPQ